VGGIVEESKGKLNRRWKKKRYIGIKAYGNDIFPIWLYPIPLYQ
jgi:hypothetical protein